MDYQYIVTVHADNQNVADDMISEVLDGWAYVHPWERMENPPPRRVAPHSLRWRWDAWRLRRHLPANYDQLSGVDKLRAVNNAVVKRDKLPPSMLRPLQGSDEVLE
jgi:hypothetical protein